ncbi:MAG: hypothetical protein ACOCX4_02655, partial [Planctomycetota bacterium]
MTSRTLDYRQHTFGGPRRRSSTRSMFVLAFCLSALLGCEEMEARGPEMPGLRAEINAVRVLPNGERADAETDSKTHAPTAEIAVRRDRAETADAGAALDAADETEAAATASSTVFGQDARATAAAVDEDTDAESASLTGTTPESEGEASTPAPAPAVEANSDGDYAFGGTRDVRPMALVSALRVDGPPVTVARTGDDPYTTPDRVQATDASAEGGDLAEQADAAEAQADSLQAEVDAALTVLDDPNGLDAPIIDEAPGAPEAEVSLADASADAPVAAAETPETSEAPTDAAEDRRQAGLQTDGADLEAASAELLPAADAAPAARRAMAGPDLAEDAPG